MKTPSASTIQDVRNMPPLNDAIPAHLLASQDPLVTNIHGNRITNVGHDVYLNNEQKEFIRIMSKSELEKRQQEIVADSGHDGLKEFE